MERLLLLRLRSTGAAEARLNGITVARTRAGGGNTSVAVHEYLVEGNNELALVVGPAAGGATPVPVLAGAALSAGVLLLLPRIGQPASETTARCLAELEWHARPGECFMPPVERHLKVELPVRFPRWRWLDLASIGAPSSKRALVHGFIQSLALSLARGDPEPFLAAARPRFEDLAVAYGQPLADMVARWRSHVVLLHATKALRPVFPAPADLVLEPGAGGRLLECLSTTGEPALRTEPMPNGSRHAWPVHVALVDDRCVIVR